MLRSWGCFIFFFLASFAGMDLCPDLSSMKSREIYITREASIIFFPGNYGLDLIHSEENFHSRIILKRNHLYSPDHHPDRMLAFYLLNSGSFCGDFCPACRIYHGNIPSHSPRNRAGPLFV